MLVAPRLLMLWAGIQLSIVLLLQQAFALWITALFILLMLYKITATWQGKATLSLKLVNLLAAAIALALILNIRQAGVLHFMLQILLLAASCRLLALKHSADARQLVWVHYFLIASCFVIHQDMFTALLIFTVFTLNLYSHFRLFAPPRLSIAWRQTSRSILIVLPLWLAMFTLFPRLPPFWQIPNAKVASTGLSDTLDPGSIEQLVKDDSLAFRVEFNGELPARSQLYWRSYLYEDFNGRSWQVNPLRQHRSQLNKALPQNTRGRSLQYRVIAEASQQHNLFALMLPTTVSNEVYIASAGLIKSNKPVSQRTSYQVTSINAPVTWSGNTETDINLQLGVGNAKTQVFAKQLAEQYPSPPQLVQAIATHFNQQHYFYSLTPPPLGNNSVDSFMFDSRTGFCSHYASAAALILRAAGIPARVVGGYQGGDWHPQQGYLAVRQREAHAWVEYLDNEQWQLFDPTAAVAPERILNSLESALTAEQRQLLFSGWEQFELLQNVRLQLMHLDYYWSVWVLGFNDTSQQTLWRNLRQHFTTILIVLAVLVGITLMLFGVFFWQRRPIQPAPEATVLVQHKLGKLLQAKAPEQSLSAFIQQLALQQPVHQHWLLFLAKTYEHAVFKDDVEALKQLQQLLKRHSKELRALRRSRIKNA